MFKKKKSLGQNFLKSKEVVSHIISASKIKRGDLVVEIGPGQGFLTEDLIEASGNVLSIEKDDRLIKKLEEKFTEQIKKGQLKIVHDDILDFDLDKWALGSSPRVTTLRSRVTEIFDYKVVANIPYYITGQIIKKFLTAKNKPVSMTLMLQKEVAQRIVAKDGKESVLSLSVKVFGEPRYVKTVKKDKFSPAPKVDSAILIIENIENKYFTKKEDQVLFFEIIKKAFNSKRKKIGTSLKEYSVELCRAGIDLNKRPEDIFLDQWIKFKTELGQE